MRSLKKKMKKIVNLANKFKQMEKKFSDLGNTVNINKKLEELEKIVSKQHTNVKIHLKSLKKQKQMLKIL